MAIKLNTEMTVKIQLEFPSGDDSLISKYGEEFKNEFKETMVELLKSEMIYGDIEGAIDVEINKFDVTK